MNLAPIAIFTYKRPEHTRRLLSCLLANPEAAHSPVHVYSDGPKTAADAPAVEATREVVRSFDIPHLELTERPRNLGLARNVIDGVSALCAAHGRVIVLEDDLYLSPTFLAFMNQALERYRDTREVMHVSGFMYPVRLPRGTQAVFLPFLSSSGWATWERAWRHFDPEASGYARLAADPRLRRAFDVDGSFYFFHMLELYRQGRADSWAIRWYLSIFMRQGLAVYPAASLVENRGFDADATHSTGIVPPHMRAKAQPFRAGALPDPMIDAEVLRAVTRLLGKEGTFHYKVVNKLRRMWRELTERPVASSPG
ncbi:hypothetical protein [Anaeromyxobacter sp. Fw109-5]|uniref:hypothetical protein n=1 Tax=Anaeromyxobacter sp. (strain Fw109-5) TaxID=404589 RepID=UPI00030DEACD|nr:hypothetical protein [Anaeromyxobacter sp. Fw109-5]